MVKYTEVQIEKERDFWINKFFGNKSVVGVVYKNMRANKQDPLGKDIALLFEKVNKLLTAITKNPKAKRLYMDVVNSYE